MKPLFLKNLSLFNYKNFTSVSFNFNAKINCFAGNNGIGKTNVLDSIYLLAFGKSYFNSIATQNVKHGEDFFMVEGTFNRDSLEEHIVCSFKKGQKKIIKRNGKPYEKFSEHVGFLPLVIISPADSNLIAEGSDTRRKFIDSVISQSDKTYLQDLIKYNKVIAQRNSLLKYFSVNNTFDEDALQVFNEQMVAYGTHIFKKRKDFLKIFSPIFKAHYQAISGGKENVSLSYQSQLFEADFLTIIQDNINKDRALQYTNTGVHKDDLVFEIETHPIKKFGSQGQQKSYLTALKLAQFDFIKKQSGVLPILLLDDIFDKLDANRVSQIIALVNQDIFGQIFISDTHAERTENVIKTINQSYQIFKL